MSFLAKATLTAALVLGGASPAWALQPSTPDHAAPPTVVTLYYSEKDPRWAAAQAKLDETAKKIKLDLKKLNIDLPENYKKLTAAEKDHSIKEADKGELTMIFGPYHLTSKGDRRDVETYLEPMITRVSSEEIRKGIKGRLPADPTQIAKDIFGEKATVIKSTDKVNEDDDVYVYHRVMAEGKRVGWIVDGYFHIKCPICNDVQFLAALSAPDLRTLEVRTVRDLERWGGPLPEADRAKFLNQFTKLNAETGQKYEPMALAHATKSTKAYEKSFQQIYSDLKKKEKQESAEK